MGDSSLWQKRLWLKSPGFDLILVTGGAFFTLTVAALAFAQPQWLPVLFWTWVIAFEGSHFWATWSRTYFDRPFRSRNRGVLVYSLAFFALPALAVYADSLQSSVSYTAFYGLFIFVWSLYHNARQHFGFMSIYAGKGKIAKSHKKRLTTLLYVGIGACQVYFLLNFKIGGALGGLFTPSSGEHQVLQAIAISIFAAACVWTIATGMQLLKTYQQRVIPTLYYLAVCLVFYSTMFFWIAPQDHFVQNLAGGETLMLIAIMNSLFHNIQYHAIVWYYGQKRYKQPEESYGWSKQLAGNTPGYVAFALIAGVSFGAITWFVGDWPSFTGSWQGVQFHSWAYVLFFGIIGHHFYLDQKIWRPSKQADLRSYLQTTNK